MADNDGVLYRPCLEDGVLLVGDLWDPGASKRIGLNLFGGSMTGKNPPLPTDCEGLKPQVHEVLQVGDSQNPATYQFTHIKNSSEKEYDMGFGAEVSCELLGGLVKITGGFNFEFGFSNNMSTEEIEILSKNPLHRIGLKTVTEKELCWYIDPHVKKLLVDGALPNNLYVVTAMDIGGQMQGSIKVTQTKKGDKYKVGFKLKGEANLFLLSGEVGFNASLGEDVEIQNYQCNITLHSMPPVPAPTVITDFVVAGSDTAIQEPGAEPRPDPPELVSPDATVPKNFVNQLRKEEHFTYWHSLGGGPAKVTGIPIRFELKPLHAVYKVNPGDPSPDPGPGKDLDDLCGAVVKAVSTLCDWVGVEFIRRQVMTRRPRAQQLFQEVTHSITQAILEEEGLLQRYASHERIQIFQKFLDFKRKYYRINADHQAEITAFRDQLNVLEADLVIKENAVDTIVRSQAAAADAQVRSVLIVRAEEDADGYGEKEQFEEKSPLIYFTHQTQITGWLRTRRYMKILYRAVQDEGGNSEERYSVRQRLYDMSPLLGRIYIQPGISYPIPSSDSSPMLQAYTPSSSLNIPEGDWTAVDSLLDFLSLVVGHQEQNSFAKNANDPRIIHLYTTHFELHNFSLNLSSSADLLPLYRFNKGVFEASDVVLCQEPEATRIACRGTGKGSISAVVIADGVKSSRHALHAFLLLLQGKVDLQQIITGTFGDLVSNGVVIQDIPLLFLAYRRQEEGVGLNSTILDYLDLLVYLDLAEGHFGDTPALIGRLETLFGTNIHEGRYPFLCSPTRVDYAKQAMNQFGKREGPLSDPIPITSVQIDTLEWNPAVDIISASLSYRSYEGVVLLAEKWTRAFQHIMEEKDAFFEDVNDEGVEDTNPIRGWIPERFSYQDTASQGTWAEVKTALITFKWKYGRRPPPHRYYGVLADAVQSFQLQAAPIEEASDDVQSSRPLKDDDEWECPGSDEDNVWTPTCMREYLDRFVLLPEFEGLVGEEFIQQLADIQLLPLIKRKALASLYLSALEEERGRVMTSLRESYILKYLVDVIGQIEETRSVRPRHLSELVHFIHIMEVEPEKPNIGKHISYTPEIKYRVASNLRLERYYHALSELVESSWETEGILNGENLRTFQVEAQRIQHITDFLNILRLIQEMGAFGETIKTRVWRNSKFIYLIEANLENQFVLKGLAKVFLRKEDGTLPRYIPRHIAAKILAALLLDDDSPILFDPTWSDNASLLKSFRVLWLSQNIPSDFQFILLQNVYEKEDSFAYVRLKEVGVLEFYNENDHYFEHVWGLDTVWKVVNALEPHQSGIKAASKSKNKQVLCQKAGNANHENVTRGSNSNDAGYLELRRKPTDASDVVDYLRYHLKVLKVGREDPKILQALQDPMRTDILTNLLSSSFEPLAKDLVGTLKASFGSVIATPVITRLTNEWVSHLPLYLNLSVPLPRIITAVRLGEAKYDRGKSQWLNQLCTLNRFSAFVSRANSGSFSGNLRGYCDAYAMNSASALPALWEELQGPQDFILVNLHGNGLEIPHHIRHLQAFTSSFIIFWNPQSLASISEAKKEWGQLVNSLAPTIDLFIDPVPEVLSYVPKEAVLVNLKEPRASNLNVAIALSKALLREPRQPGHLSETGNVRVPGMWKEAQELTSFINQVSLARVKSSLLLYAAEDALLPEAVNDHYEGNETYREVVKLTLSLLTSPTWTTALAQVVGSIEGRRQLSPYLSAVGEVTDGAMKGYLNPTALQALTGHFRNLADIQRLHVTELIYEICKLVDANPALLPPGLEPASYVFNLFQEGHAVPVPALPARGFFIEPWSLQLLDMVRDAMNFKVLVVSVLCEDGVSVSSIMSSLYGPSFSTAAKSEWSQTLWAGTGMRMVPFEESLKTETGLEGILLLSARALCPEVFNGHPALLQKDKQLATFLLSLSNVTLVFEVANDGKLFQNLLQTCLIALNKIEEHEKTSRLIFVGEKTPLQTVGIESALKAAEAVEVGWSDPLDVSFFGRRSIRSAISMVEKGGSLVDLSDKSIVTDLSEALIDLAVLTPTEECPFLPDFLMGLNPRWEFIKDHIKFPHDDLEEMDKQKEYQRILFRILDEVDASFQYHAEDMASFAFKRMADIVNYWLSGEYGQVAVKTKKEILTTELQRFVDEIFDSCTLAGREDDDELRRRRDDEAPTDMCSSCIIQQTSEAALPDEFDDYGQYTRVRMLKEIQEYIRREKWHYGKLAKQMMVGIETSLLEGEENSYKDAPGQDEDEYDLPGMTDVQKASLQRRIVGSRRRWEGEAKGLFPGVDLELDSWDEGKDEEDFAYLTTIDAWGPGETLPTADADALELALRKLPETEVRMGGSVGIYQSGMVRRLIRSVDESLSKITPKLLSTFKNQVLSHTFWRLLREVEKREESWSRDYDPLWQFLNSSKRASQK